MQLIECPWCGPREEIEFRHGGEAHVPYPERPADLDDTEWAHFVFFRHNTKGVYAERWLHQAGCRKWFNALRDTVTYRFHATYAADESVLDFPAAAELAPAQRDAARIRDAALLAGRGDGMLSNAPKSEKRDK